MEDSNNFKSQTNNWNIDNLYLSKNNLIINFIDNHAIDRSINCELNKKNHINLQSIVKVLDYMKETNCSIAHAQLHFHNKSYGSIYKWIPNKNMIYQKAGINNAKLTVHPGPKQKYENVEDELLNFINFNIKARLPITLWSLVREFDKLAPKTIKDNEHTKYTRVYRFLKKNGYTIRSPNHKGSLYSLDSFNIIIAWHRKLRDLFLKTKRDNDLIINMDETPAFFNPEIKAIIAPKGAHSVVIKTQSQEKHRYFLVLLISANGRKLKPLIIFKANYSDYMISQLNQIPIFKEKRQFFM